MPRDLLDDSQDNSTYLRDLLDESNNSDNSQQYSGPGDFDVLGQLKQGGNNISNLLQGVGGFYYNAPENISELFGGHLYDKGTPSNPNSGFTEVGQAIAPFLIPGLGSIYRGSNAALKLANLGKVIPSIGSGAAVGTTMAALSGSPLSTGAITGGLLGGIPAAASSIFNKFRPSNLFRGTLTPQQLSKNLNVYSGTETNLGDVIGSPILKRLYENTLPKIPFSGGNQSMQLNAVKVTDKGHDILNKILGNNNSEDAEYELNDALKKSFNEHRQDKNNLYLNSNNIAEKTGLKLNLDKLNKTSQEYRDAIESMPILKQDPKLSSLFNKLKDYQYSGNDVSLKEANILKGRLNDLSEEYSNSPAPMDRYSSYIFGKLSSSLKSDINNSIEDHGNDELSKVYSDAEKNYSENFSPFLDKEIYKFTTGRQDPDMLIQSFIKTGKSTDRANLLNKLVDKLPDDKKNLLGYAYLSRALDRNGVLKPTEMTNLLSKRSLGTRQFKALFPDEKIRNDLMDYSQLVNSNSKGLKSMINPDNGQVNMDVLPLISKSWKTLLAKLLVGRPMVNSLTSEQTRNKMVQRMIQSDSKIAPKRNESTVREGNFY